MLRYSLYPSLFTFSDRINIHVMNIYFSLIYVLGIFFIVKCYQSKITL